MDIISPLDSGGFILSYKCNCHCRHCLYCAGPRWKDWMDIGDAGRIFLGLARTQPYMQGFHLAGGEPFLNFDLLLRVLKLASEFSVPISYVETNAGWCADEEDVRLWFEQLREAGLGTILISCSPFHAEHIPLGRTSAAIKVGREVFGPSGVLLWVPEFYKQLSGIATDRPITLEEYESSIGLHAAGHMIRTGYSIISGGRVGYTLAKYFQSQPPEFCAEDNCRPELLKSGHAHFDPYGNFIPGFCSGISLGDARELRTLIKGFDLDRLPLVRMLSEGGPFALYQFAQKEFGYKALPGGYIGKCHLCVDLRRWIVQQTDQFSELTPPGFYENLLP